MIATIDARIRRLMGSVRQAFRGVGTQVNSAPPIQLIDGEGLADEPLRAMELMQHYGITSVPPAGFAYVVIPVGGKTAHGIVVATEHASFRLKGLANGEMAIYDDQGQKVHLTRAGIVIDGAGKPITIHNAPRLDIDIPQVNMTGALTVAQLITGQGGMAVSGGASSTVAISGNLDTTGTIRNNGKDVGSTHTHGGVRIGSDNSSAPN
jgi:phage baseplate assembly protein V